MSLPQAWAGRYVGIPFCDKGRGPEFDCWGLVRAVRQQELGEHDLPDYAGAYTSPGDKLSVAGAITAGLAAGWHRTDAPQPFDLVILRLAGRPWHCGILVGGGWFLHTTERTGAVCERLDSLQWRGRVEGFYSRKVSRPLYI